MRKTTCAVLCLISFMVGMTIAHATFAPMPVYRASTPPPPTDIPVPPTIIRAGDSVIIQGGTFEQAVTLTDRHSLITSSIFEGPVFSNGKLTPDNYFALSGECSTVTGTGKIVVPNNPNIVIKGNVLVRPGRDGKQ